MRQTNRQTDKHASHNAYTTDTAIVFLDTCIRQKWTEVNDRCINITALIVATWGDRFSWRCWRLILAISRVSINPTPDHHARQSLFITFGPCHRCCLAATARGRGQRDTWVNKGRANPLRLQQLDCHWGEVLTESRLRLRGATMSVSDHTGCPARSHTRSELADDSREIGRSIGALINIHE